MLIEISLIGSVILQFGAFFITISLIPKTKYNVSWITISIGFFLMALRRLSDLYTLYHLDEDNLQSLSSSWIAVFISILMFVSSFYIRRIFELFEKVNRERNENEAKVLSAVLNTEENDKKSFAKELHDGLGPILSSVKLNLSAINPTEDDKRSKEIIRKTEENIDQAILTINEISNRLSPHNLENYGLEKAVKKLLNNIVSKADSNISFISDIGSNRFESKIEVVIYRIIGELLNNNLKHAFATKTDISVLKFENKILLLYEDNGVGFNAEKTKNQGMGIKNIKSRVKSTNGEITILSRPNHGLFVKIEIPL